MVYKILPSFKLRDSKEFIYGCIILFIRFVYYKNMEIGVMFPDSGSYIDYTFNGRTPVYPFIIDLWQLILGDNFAAGVVVFQIAISLLSVLFLYKTLIILTGNTNLSFFITALYGISPTVIGYDALILTESLAMSGSVFFLYFIVNYIKQISIKYGVCSILIALLLTMHKPSFLLFNYALLFFWLFRLYYIQERKIIYKLLLIQGISIAVIMAWSYEIYKVYGVFSITPLAPRHLLAACLNSGIYENFYDAKLVSKINEIFVSNGYSIGYDTTTPVMSLFGADIREQNIRVEEFCIKCIKLSPLAYLKYLCYTALNNINTLLMSRLQTAYETYLYIPIMDLFAIISPVFKIGHYYISFLVEVIIVIMQYLKHRCLNWIHFGLAAFVGMSLAFVFVGTYGDYGRNLSHMFPFLIVSLALLLNKSIKFLNTERE